MNDDDPVIMGYAAPSNITFHGFVDLGVTWGEWRSWDYTTQNDVIQEAASELVDAWIVDEEKRTS